MKKLHEFDIETSHYELMEYEQKKEYWLYKDGTVVAFIYRKEVNDGTKHARFREGISEDNVDIDYLNVEGHMAIDEAREFLEKREA